jgi:hypothetical protein
LGGSRVAFIASQHSVDDAAHLQALEEFRGRVLRDRREHEILENGIDICAHLWNKFRRVLGRLIPEIGQILLCCLRDFVFLGNILAVFEIDIPQDNSSVRAGRLDAGCRQKVRQETRVAKFLGNLLLCHFVRPGAMDFEYRDIFQEDPLENK